MYVKLFLGKLNSLFAPHIPQTLTLMEWHYAKPKIQKILTLDLKFQKLHKFIKINKLQKIYCIFCPKSRPKKNFSAVIIYGMWRWFWW